MPDFRPERAMKVPLVGARGVDLDIRQWAAQQRRQGQNFVGSSGGRAWVGGSQAGAAMPGAVTLARQA